MLNKCTLIGNLGRDPEVHDTDSGRRVAQFNLATNRRWTDREGNRQEQTDWHQIVCFGRQAEIVAEYLTKGRQVYVEGRLQTRSWEDRQSGERRYRTEVVGRRILMLGQRPRVDETPADLGNGAPPPEDPGAEADQDTPF